MGYCKFGPNTRTSFSLEAYTEEGQQLQLSDYITDPEATIVVWRRPGSFDRPYANCKTEDERLAAYIAYTASEWKESFKIERARKRAAKRRSAAGIPCSLLRLAVTDEEKETAMEGLGGTLVVYRDCEALDLSLLVK